MDTTTLFQGTKNECKKYLSPSSGYYVYILRRPDGRPFYVGKGTGDRVFHHENDARHPNDRRSNSYKLNVIRSIWRLGNEVIYEISYQTPDEQLSLDKEAKLIQELKRLHEGGPLTNLAPGGGSSSGASPVSKDKKTKTLGGIPDDDPDRAKVNRYLLSIGEMNSVAIKPTAQFIAKPTIILPKKKGGPTVRQAAVLIASAAINGITMDGQCEIPRKLNIEGVPALIENGVSCRILLTEMATLITSDNPADEKFQLTVQQSKVAISLIGEEKCLNLGVISSLE